MFRYLSAEDICKFFDKFEDQVIKRSGLDADELGELSRTEINQMLNAIFDDVVITKDNIHLYYEFMSDEDIKKYRHIIMPMFNDRLEIINKSIKLDAMYISAISLSVFGIKDTLKPIDEYIAEIKATEEYRAYISSKLAQQPYPPFFCGFEIEKGNVMGYINFSDVWCEFVKNVKIDIPTLINEDKFKKLCHDYIAENNLDVNIIEQLLKDRKLKLAQMSD